MEKCFWPPPGKKHYCPTTGKNLSKLVCVDQSLSNYFAHDPLSIKCIISAHLVYAGVII